MFKNCGSTVKGIALINFWLVVIVGVIVGIWLLSEEGPVGLLVIAGAVIGGWLENVALYTIGDTWERTVNLEKKLSESSFKASKENSSAPDSASNGGMSPLSQMVSQMSSGVSSSTWRCPKCGKSNPSSSRVCKDCGYNK